MGTRWPDPSRAANGRWEAAIVTINYAPPAPRSPRSRAPRQGRGPLRPRPDPLLLLCRYGTRTGSTDAEAIAWVQRLSRFPITVLNMEEHGVGTDNLQLAPDVDLDAYAGVILHHTLTGEAGPLRGLDTHAPRKLRDYAGVKVLMRREDGRDARGIAEHVAQTGYDLLLTDLPPEGAALLYPAAVLGGARVERTARFHVTPAHRAIDPREEARPIDVGYRGVGWSLSVGRRAYGAGRIGAEVARRLSARGLALDIADRGGDLLDEDARLRRLLACRATLGAEAGPGLFDLDGGLADRLAAIEAELGPARDDEIYALAYLDRLADLEGRIDAAQIGPDQFEAAACGTLQVLLPGRYSGLLVPGRDFVPIEPDLDAAVAVLRDDARRREIVEAARARLILDPAHGIEAFVARLDDRIEALAGDKGVLAVAKARIGSSVEAGHRGERHVLLLTVTEPRHDPRHGWTERHAPPGVLVHQIGVVESDQAPILRASARGGLDWAVPRLEWTEGTAHAWFGQLGTSPAAVAVLHELAFLERAHGLPQEAFARLLGAPTYAPRLGSLRFYMRVLLAATRTLVEAGSRLRGVQAIVASDAHALPAAILLKELFGVEVLYDAHEYMPEVLPESNEFERQFFSGLERRLVAHTAARQTVTPGLAELMGAEYGLPFDVVVNAEPNEDAAFEPIARPDSGTCVFLFCGLFGSGRGLALLVDAWPDTPPGAILHLQGPDNALRRELIARAEANGLLGTRILFPEAVLEAEIVASMRQADVGLIPYEPISTNHRHCCPNKTSQYMRAGLPILANDTHFVGATIREAECGRVVDFRDRARFAAAVAELAGDPDLRRRLAGNARAHFEGSFNWQARSRVMYARLETMLAGRDPGELIAVSLPEPIPQAPPAEAAPAEGHGAAEVEVAPAREIAESTGSAPAARRAPAGLRGLVRPLARAIGIRR